jgi:hypothetical protein
MLFRLSKSGQIQMLTALVLQLIQCVVVLPERLGRKQTARSSKEMKKETSSSKGKENGEEAPPAEEDAEAGVDRDVLVSQR